MITIAIVSLKGGAGKTTLAVNLAVIAHLAGQRVMVTDCDPQGSATLCLSARRGSGPRVRPLALGALFQDGQTAAREGMDLRVIDTPPGPKSDVAACINAADACLVVCRPTFLDIASVARTAALLSQLGRPGAVVLNQTTPPRGGVTPPQVRRAAEAIALTRLPLIAVLPARLAWQQSLADGRSVVETAPETCRREVAQLWAGVGNLLQGLGGRRAA